MIEPSGNMSCTRDGKRRSKKASSRVQLCLKPWTPSSHPTDHQTNHSDYHSRTFTKSVVLDLCQSAESRPVLSNLVWLSLSPQSTLPPKSSPWKCTTNPSRKLDQVTMLASTSRTSLLRISVVVTSHRTPKMTPL